MKPRTDPSIASEIKRVVFDTNALFRFHVRALILHMAHAQAITPLWSARTVEELRGVLSARGKSGAEDFLGQLPTSTILATGAGIAAKGFRDPGDLHVVQAAIDGHASVIVTQNARDFPAKHLRPLGIERLSPDGFFATHLAALPVGLDPADLRRAGLSQTAKRFSPFLADRG